jgi:hypothetical protein
VALSQDSIFLSPVSPGLFCDVSTPPSPIDAVVVEGTVIPAGPIQLNVLVGGANGIGSVTPIRSNRMGFVTPNPNAPPPDVDVAVPPKVKPVP